MKFNYLMIVAVAMMAVLTSCDLEEVLDNVELNTDLEVNETFEVVLTENDPTTFEETRTFSAEVEDMDVTGIEISAINYTVSNYTASGKSQNMRWNISIGGVSTGVTGELTNITNVFQVQNGILEAWEEYLLDNPEATIVVSAELDEVPVSFDVELDMTLKVTGTKK